MYKNHERSQLKQVFDMFDDDRQGRVQAGHLKSALLDISRDSPSGVHSNLYRLILELDKFGEQNRLSYQDFTKIFDSNTTSLIKGGQVSREEAQLVSVCLCVSQRQDWLFFPHRLLQLFSLIDVEETGKIGYRDLKRLADELSECGTLYFWITCVDEPISAIELQEMIHRADIDGDGYVNLVSETRRGNTVVLGGIYADNFITRQQ